MKFSSTILLSSITLATDVLSTGPARVVRGHISSTGFQSSPPAEGCYWVCPAAPGGGGGLSSTPASILPSGVSPATTPTGSLSATLSRSSIVVVPSNNVSNSATVSASTPSSNSVIFSSSAAALNASSASTSSTPRANSTVPLLSGAGGFRPTRTPSTIKPSGGFAASTGSVPFPTTSPLKNGAAVNGQQLGGSVVGLAVAMAVISLQWI